MLHTDSTNLTDAEHIDEIIFQAISAQDAYLQLDQKSIDRIVKRMARVGASNHLALAKMAVAETGKGIIEDKSITNTLASIGLEQKLGNIKSVGLIENNTVAGYQVFSEPVGILASILPPEHPTATILFQAILSVKTRNPVVFSFHPSVKSSSIAAAKLMLEAALESGAPPHAIQWLPSSSEMGVQALTQHPEIALILMDENTTTLSSLLSTDTPILGLGQINTPCFIDRSADQEQAITDIIFSKSFDNGLMSTSEQVVIICNRIYSQILDLLLQKSCHLADKEERELLEELLFHPDSGAPNPECIGRDACTIAEMAGFSVPTQTKIICAEIGGIGPDYPLSSPKPFPVLALLLSESWYEALCFCEAVLELGTSAHTAVIHTRKNSLTREFSTRLGVTHTIVNGPATHGDICHLSHPGSCKFTSAVDRQNGNPTTATLSVNKLLSRKIVQQRPPRLREWEIPKKILFSPNCINYLKSFTGVERTLIVTEKGLINSRHMDTILHHLGDQKHPVQTEIFHEIAELTTLSSIEQGMQRMNLFQPTAVLVLGDKTTIDTAKAMRFLYQRPKITLPHSPLHTLVNDFSDCRADPPQKSIPLVAIPTNLGTGSEMNSFVTIYDQKREKPINLHSCELIPDCALIDPSLSIAAAPLAIAMTGMAILSHALEAYASALASDYSDSMAMKATELIFTWLPVAAGNQPSDEATEKIYNAAAMAGMAASNAMLGLNHAMAHSLSFMFELPHDLANNLLLPHIIRYNGVENPSRFNPLTPGSRYVAHERYQEIAKVLGLAENSPEEGVKSLVYAITQLQKQLALPLRLRDYGIAQQEYLSKVEDMAELAFEDHCTATNPRLPLIPEIIDIYTAIY
ncbi:MAG: iron-containing alcohol dehydrogenase [Proteobacteria bacterium]|nr:iron-containing alcohol dehydrogenase [Pseudomonadota bacterium]MBU1059014.1 iron-containing alcohol dehydrogenase [Pseudomonadota bacterium]